MDVLKSICPKYHLCQVEQGGSFVMPIYMASYMMTSYEYDHHAF
jgi:hypothetical protein